MCPLHHSVRSLRSPRLPRSLQQTLRAPHSTASAGYVLTLATTHGARKIQSAGQGWGGYMQLAVHDPSAHALMFALLFALSRPMAFAVLPIITVDGYFFCLYLERLLPVFLANALSSRGRSLVDRVMGGGGWTHAQLQGKIPTWNALMEVVIGLAMLMELCTPFRNILVTVFYWQFLRLKHMLSPYSKAAFAQLHGFLGPKMGKLPLIGRAYALMVRGMAYMVEIPKPGEKSMASKCSIM